MNPQTINSWIQLVTLGVQQGIVAFTAIREVVRAGNSGATDAELNEIVTGVMRNLSDLRARIEAERAALRQMPGWVEPTEG